MLTLCKLCLPQTKQSNLISSYMFFKSNFVYLYLSRWSCFALHFLFYLKFSCHTLYNQVHSNDTRAFEKTIFYICCNIFLLVSVALCIQQMNNHAHCLEILFGIFLSTLFGLFLGKVMEWNSNFRSNLCLNINSRWTCYHLGFYLLQFGLSTDYIGDLLHHLNLNY